MKKYLNDIDSTKIVKVFDELPLWSAPFGLKLLEYINYKPNISALDIGFGAGFPLIEVAMRLGEGSTVYGIDPWKDAITLTNKKLEHYEMENIRIIEGVAESIPLNDNFIDLIISNNGINNVSDIGQVIAECSRIIKPGGQFVMTMNLDKSMFEFYSELESVLKEYGMNKEVEAMYKHIAQKRPSVDFILDVLRKNGFITKDLEYDKFDYRFATGTAMLNHNFIRSVFVPSWINLVPADKLEDIFDAIETRLNQQAEKLGEVKLTIPFVIINAIKE
jgi:Methylase involved in ubiquinone/menaquinone biosynthesis